MKTKTYDIGCSCCKACNATTHKCTNVEIEACLLDKALMLDELGHRELAKELKALAERVASTLSEPPVKKERS